MRARHDDCAEYLARVAAFLERCGVALRLSKDDDLELLEDDDGVLSFELLGDLPGRTRRATARVAIREEFRPVAPDLYERSRYEYELLDTARNFRRTFHLHFPEYFERRFLVVVHEHCERPIGHVDCDHFEGPPIRDAYAGANVLMDAWTGEPPDCRSLRCLE